MDMEGLTCRRMRIRELLQRCRYLQYPLIYGGGGADGGACVEQEILSYQSITKMGS